MEIEVLTPGLPTRYDDRFWSYVRTTVTAILRGKTNNIGEFSTEVDTDNTKVFDSRITDKSHLSFTGLDKGSNSGILYVIDRQGREGYFVVGHPVSEVAMKFSYSVTG